MAPDSSPNENLKLCDHEQSIDQPFSIQPYFDAAYVLITKIGKYIRETF